MRKKSSTSKAAVQPVSSPDPTPVSERPVSPLRERMLGLMAERGFAEATRIAYVRGVLGLVERYGGRGPEAITVDEARAYVLWLKSSGASPAVRSNASAGLRFLYESVLGRTWKPVSCATTERRSCSVTATGRPARPAPRASRRTSSSAATSGTCCPRASEKFATSGCTTARGARPCACSRRGSPSRGSCLCRPRASPSASPCPHPPAAAARRRCRRRNNSVPRRHSVSGTPPPEARPKNEAT